MYLTGKLEIDPSQTTLIKKVKADKFFKKFLDTLTFGQVTPKQEQETFTAVSILQQIYMGLKAIKIDNIIRLSVDDYDFYLDETGEENDLEKAMFEFTAKVDPIESELFNNIYLVLEHFKDDIKYLIEIRISRRHKVGEYPIVININGVFTRFTLPKEGNVNDLKHAMKPLFADKGEYEQFISQKRASFDDFLDELELAAKKFIKVDDIIKNSKVQIIRPMNEVKTPEQMRHDRFANPVYYGYYGFDSYFFYAWLWAGMMYDYNVYASDFSLVDDFGRDIMQIGNQGFNAGDYDTLNPGTPFVPPDTGDIDYFGDNEYQDQLFNADLLGGEETFDNGEDMDWLDIGSGEEN